MGSYWSPSRMFLPGIPLSRCSGTHLETLPQILRTFCCKPSRNRTCIPQNVESHRFAGKYTALSHAVALKAGWDQNHSEGSQRPAQIELHKVPTHGGVWSTFLLQLCNIVHSFERRLTHPADSRLLVGILSPGPTSTSNIMNFASRHLSLQRFWKLARNQLPAVWKSGLYKRRLYFTG